MMALPHYLDSLSDLRQRFSQDVPIEALNVIYGSRGGSDCEGLRLEYMHHPDSARYRFGETRRYFERITTLDLFDEVYNPGDSWDVNRWPDFGGSFTDEWLQIQFGLNPQLLPGGAADECILRQISHLREELQMFGPMTDPAFVSGFRHMARLARKYRRERQEMDDFRKRIVQRMVENTTTQRETRAITDRPIGRKIEINSLMNTASKEIVKDLHWRLEERSRISAEKKLKDLQWEKYPEIVAEFFKLGGEFDMLYKSRGDAVKFLIPHIEKAIRKEKRQKEKEIDQWRCEHDSIYRSSIKRMREPIPEVCASPDDFGRKPKKVKTEEPFKIKGSYCIIE